MKSHRFPDSSLTSVNCLLKFGERTLFKLGQIDMGEKWVREAEMLPTPNSSMMLFHLS